MAETFNWNVNLNQDTDTKDELDKVLTPETLAKLKESFPEKMDEIFVITKEELSKLKTLISENKQDEVTKLIRKNLIEDDVDGEEYGDKEEDKVSLDTITLWNNSETMEKVKLSITSSVRKELENFTFLNEEQKINITIWIAGKIFKENKNNKSLENDFADLENDKLWEIKDILSILSATNWMEDIKYILKKYEWTPEKLDNILSNPKAIENLNKDTNIENINEATQEELTEYLLNINEDVLSYDKKLKQFNKNNWDIINLISKTWDKFQKSIKMILKKLMEFPIIWEILAAILWYNSWKEAIEWFWEDINRAKSTNNLKSHWQNKETNPISIKLLKDKDLSWLDYKELAPFFQNCKNAWIDYTDKKFWSELFNWSDDEKFKELREQFQLNEITDDDFDNKKPTDNFYNKLNKIKLKSQKEKTEEKKKTEEETKKAEKEEEKKTEEEKMSKEELISEKQKVESSKVEIEDLKEWWLKFSLDVFDKLDKSDLKLLNKISLEELLDDDNYKKIIQDTVWIDGWFQVIDDYFNENYNHDYESIENTIEKLRTILTEYKWKTIDWKELSDISIWDLLNKDSNIYREVFKIEKLEKIEAELKKRTEKKHEEVWKTETTNNKEVISEIKTE